jgi:hypothetical protein
MREQTVANHHHHHLCEATREEMGGEEERRRRRRQRPASGENYEMFVGSQESSRKLRTGKHNQKMIRTATVPVRRESRSSADLSRLCMAE